MTLIELCFGLSLVALLAGMAAPGFRSSLRAAAIRSATFELLVGVQQARASAILEARPAELCPSDAAGNCLASYTPASFWRVSHPAGDTRPGSVESPPVNHALPSGVVVRASRSPLRFSPTVQNASPGTLTICDAQGVAAPRAIALSLAGRPRVADATPGSCR